VDDDNWLAADWLARAAAVMRAHPEADACGGASEAVSDAPLPPWFAPHAPLFAVGAQAPREGRLDWPRYSLWGTGLCIRRSAWRALVDGGFQPVVRGRVGSTATAARTSS